MVKKLLAAVLLLVLIGYALWQALLPEDAVMDKQPEQYADYVNASADREEMPVSGIEKGQEAPAFRLPSIDGKDTSLADFKGKKVILNFWATWCPPCKAEMPEMQKFHEQYGEDVKILAVNLTSTEANPKQVQAFLKERGLTFPVLLDKEDEVGTKQYKVLTIPTSYFINEQGQIVERVDGPMNFAQMERFAKSK
ncbi:TlpA family protein disulfide reductase [Bacillus songklensis]|uniref:TlpA family protein disulfide reductase n=1 Tax=Bacillus songklensis TaxID=1069116 RepID=A0ABV8BA95_9BACI